MMWATHLPTFVVLLQMVLTFKTFLPKRLPQLTSALPLTRPKPHLQEANNSTWPYEGVIHSDTLSSHTSQIFHTPNQISSRSNKPQEIQSFFHPHGPTASSYDNLGKHHTDLSNYDLTSIASTDSGVERERFQQHEEYATFLLKPIPTITSLKSSDTTQPVTLGVNWNVKQNTFRQLNYPNYGDASPSKPSFKVNTSMAEIKEDPAFFLSPESTSSAKVPNNYFIPASFSLPTSQTAVILKDNEKPEAVNILDENGHLDKRYTHRLRKIRSLEKGCHSQHLKTCGSNVIKEFSAGIASLSSKCQIRKEFLDCMVQQREIECAPSEASAVSPQETEPIRNKVTNLLRSVNGCLLL